jgi:hypothetical protein
MVCCGSLNFSSQILPIASVLSVLLRCWFLKCAGVRRQPGRAPGPRGVRRVHPETDGGLAVLHQPEARDHAGCRAGVGDGDQESDRGRPRRGQGGAQDAQRALRLRHHPGRRAGAEILRGRRVTREPKQQRAVMCRRLERQQAAALQQGI